MGYEEKKTILEAGEEVLFYSDGLVEAHNPKGEMFGFPGLGRSSPSTLRRGRWGTISWRSSTPSWGRVGNRRMTSPSLPYDSPPPEAELLGHRYIGSSHNPTLAK